MMKALVLVATTLSEHWVCATPVSPVGPSYNIFLYDFEIEGDELVEKVPEGTGENLRHRILRNDDQRIIFEWEPPPAKSLAVIEKRAVFDPSFKVYQGGKMSVDGNVEGSIFPKGTCEMFR
jgi:hypothetical protein